MDGIGILTEEVSNQKTDTGSCAISWSDQTIGHRLGEFLGNATCCQASVETP